LKSDTRELASYFAALEYRVVPRDENWIALPGEIRELNAFL
jgi:hypothetical protein